MSRIREYLYVCVSVSSVCIDRIEFASYRAQRVLCVVLVFVNLVDGDDAMGMICGVWRILCVCAVHSHGIERKRARARLKSAMRGAQSCGCTILVDCGWLGCTMYIYEYVCVGI